VRLFFALWPPAETARLLAAWARETQPLTGGRATDEAKIHLTLAFLGEADAAKALRAATRARGRAHQLPIEQARYWRENNIVWVGPRETPEALKALHSHLGSELEREGFALERRAFAAHVTLLRKAGAGKLPTVPAVEWPVQEFVLVRSALSSKGAIYEPLERFTLSEG
jgi:RNA 2',3'-cyclic 3'-phosphodiesterase